MQKVDQSGGVMIAVKMATAELFLLLSYHIDSAEISQNSLDS